MKATMSRTFHHGQRHQITGTPTQKQSDLEFHAKQLFYGSRYYKENMHSLSVRVLQGKITELQASHIRPAIAAQTLRDANVAVEYSRRLLAASGLRA